MLLVPAVDAPAGVADQAVAGTVTQAMPAVPELRHASTLTPERDHEDAGPDDPLGEGDGTIGTMAAVVIVGAGPGIGLSVAHRFAAAGMPAGLIARTAASTGTTRAALAATGVPVAEATADAGRDDQLTAALDAITGQFGPPEALIYNAGLIGATGRGS